MVNYQRNKIIKGGIYFFTTNLLNRQKSFLTDEIDKLHFVFRRLKKYFYLLW